MEEGTLSLHAGGHYLGIGHSGLKGKVLYPVVSAVWGHCEITMRYHGSLGRMLMMFYIFVDSNAIRFSGPA